MRWLDDLGQVEGEPPDAKERLAEVMADPKRRTASVGVASPRYPTPAPHGTRSGYERHRQAHERTCDACRAAERDYRRRHRA